MDMLEVVDQIKCRDENPQGMAEIFSDRVLVKSKDPKWAGFPHCVMCKAFLADYERTKNFKVYEDDIWLIGFQRSGTTLLQEILWLIMNDYDFEGAKKVDTYNRAQWFDFFNATHPLQGVEVDYLDKMPRPRIFKTHFPVQFLPDQIWTVKPRVIYIKRDVKDVAVSHYYLRLNTFHDDVKSKEEHFEDFLNDKVWYTPYREHVLNYMRIPDKTNILYVDYEGLLADKAGTIKKVVDFLGKTITDEIMEKLLDHVQFEKMKTNKATNMTRYMELFNQLSQHDRPTDSFIRKGVVGDHKNQMPEDFIKRFDEWMAASSSLKPGYNE